MSASDTPGTILIVEDNPMMRTFYQISLKNLPTQIAFAADGKKGYDLARQLLPSMIIMDINLPGMDGLVVTKLIRSEPALADVPILAVTARHRDDPALRAHMFNEILFKPVKVDDLRNAVVRFLPDLGDDDEIEAKPGC